MPAHRARRAPGRRLAGAAPRIGRRSRSNRCATLIEQVGYRPFEGRSRVVVIDDARTCCCRRRRTRCSRRSRSRRRARCSCSSRRSPTGCSRPCGRAARACGSDRLPPPTWRRARTRSRRRTRGCPGPGGRGGRQHRRGARRRGHGQRAHRRRARPGGGGPRPRCPQPSRRREGDRRGRRRRGPDSASGTRWPCTSTCSTGCSATWASCQPARTRARSPTPTSSPRLQGLAPSFDRARLVRAFAAVDRALGALDRNASPKIVADWLVLQL